MFSHCFAMYFALVCIIGMLKFTAKRANTRSHNHPTCTWLHLIGNDEVKSFYQTMLLRPCPTWSLMVHFFCMSFHFLLFYFFTTVNNWLRESTITFKYAQQATTTAHAFISSFCCDIFLLFWTFEQISVGFDTLVTVKKENCLREGTITLTASHNNKVTTT